MTRGAYVVPIVLIVASASSAAFAQESGRGATGPSRTVVACVAPESDYVRAASPDVRGTTGVTALVLTDVATGRPLLNVTGLREAELAQHVGRRVEITGDVEPPRTTPVLTTAEGTVTGSVSSEPAAAGVTVNGAAAHEPSDARADSVAARPLAEPTRVSDPAYFLGLLPGLRPTSYRLVDGDCVSAAAGGATARAQVTSPADPAVEHSPAPLPRAAAPASERVSVRGCLVRQTPGGTALTPQKDSADALVLADASLLSEQTDGARGAVPGSAPSDPGSGTVPGAAATARRAPVDAATVSFQLVMTDAQRAELAARVGERIEVVGQVEEDAQARSRTSAEQQPPPGRVQVAPVEVAHVSTPARRLTISSFRAVGGTCH